MLAGCALCLLADDFLLCQGPLPLRRRLALACLALGFLPLGFPPLGFPPLGFPPLGFPALRFPACFGSLGGDDFRQALDEVGQACLVPLQLADFTSLRGDLFRQSVQRRLALRALGEQLGMFLALLVLRGGELRRLLAGVGGQGLLPLQVGVDLQEKLAACPSNRFEVVQVARQLVGVVTVEKQLQRIRIATQVLPVEQFFELLLLQGQPLLERLGLAIEVFELAL